MFNISKPLEFYYWSTPNGDKIAILLEELSIPYDLKPINILRGDQYSPEFLAISPNNKIPAIKQDNQTLFESGAIMLILAETTQQLIPIGKRNDTLQWLFWQMGGLGPMAGQNHHFNFYAPEPIPYAKERYIKETKRLYGVLETQLTGREYIVDEFSIADIACYPWVLPHDMQGILLQDYPNIANWVERISQRPAVIKAADLNQRFSAKTKFDEEARQHFFK